MTASVPVATSSAPAASSAEPAPSAAVPTPTATAPPNGRARLRLTVASTDTLTEEVRQLTLVPRDGAPLPSHPPGSHLGLIWRQPPERVNSYSLTSDGHSPAAYTVSVLRVPDGNGGSARAHRLRPGDEIEAVLPRSTFPVAARARRHLLVAGGIGITPLLAHARWHLRWGADFTLYYSHKPGRAAHLDELRALCDDRLRAHHDRESLWADLGPALRRQPLGTQLYVCGPLSMIDAVAAAAQSSHWAASRVRSEAFGAPADGPRAPFRVTRADGAEIHVSAAETLLEALERSAVGVPSLCRGGVCGECRTPLAGGLADHRDLVLSPAEKASGRWIMPCVSRAAGEELELAL